MWDGDERSAEDKKGNVNGIEKRDEDDGEEDDA